MQLVAEIFIHNVCNLNRSNKTASHHTILKVELDEEWQVQLRKLFFTKCLKNCMILLS